MNCKKIVILDSGILKLKGSPYGPIPIPYMESISNISILVCNNTTVMEVLADNTRIKLDMSNFDKDNSHLITNSTIAPDTIEKFTETIVPVKKEEVVIESEEIIVEEISEEHTLSDDIVITNRNKKNKHRK